MLFRKVFESREFYKFLWVLEVLKRISESLDFCFFYGTLNSFDFGKFNNIFLQIYFEVVVF